MTREQVRAKAEHFIDRALADTARQTMTSIILRDDCDLDAAADSIAEYSGEHREELIRFVEAVLLESERRTRGNGQRERAAGVALRDT